MEVAYNGFGCFVRHQPFPSLRRVASQLEFSVSCAGVHYRGQKAHLALVLALLESEMPTGSTNED